MKRITIDTEKIRGAYKGASAEQQKVLRELFGELMELSKPTLDDYTTIRTYEDACEALGEKPLLYEPRPTITLYGTEYEVSDHIIALMKLETISRALWGRKWKPKPVAKDSTTFYFPFLALYTKSEIENSDEEMRRRILFVYNSNYYLGFSSLPTTNRNSNVFEHFGFRLCQETDEKAKYFGKQFIELWAEYLRFGFEVGGRLQ